MRRLLKAWLPPAIVSLCRKWKNGSGYEGSYASWQEALAHSTGYDSDLILEKVSSALLKVKSGEAVYERDSILFDQIQYSWPLLAGLLWVASQSNNRLNIIDFGGSLGSSYYQNIKFLSHLSELHWAIVEQEAFVECGKSYFESEHVKFYRSLDECISRQGSEAILLSGVIQYLEKPYDLLDEIIGKSFRYIIFDRTSFLKEGDDLLTVQKAHPDIFEASYPCWFFNVDKFKDQLLSNYDLFAESDGFEKANVENSMFKGLIFRKKGQ